MIISNLKKFIFILSLVIVAGLSPLRAQLIPPDVTKYKPSVSPLLTTTWGQSKPYNLKCPTKTNSSGVEEHCPVGCVALALGQIMKFYDYPEVGNGKKEYRPFLSKDTLRADFGATHYNWPKMRDSYLSVFKNYTDEEADAVSTLLYHIGVSVGMIYQLSGSSAFAYGNIPRDMVENFRYDPEGIRYVTRSDFTKEQWMDMIYNELSNDRPIFYCGNSPKNGGHAWVVDGYNASGEVHINFGWRGSDDDYYDIDLSSDVTDNDYCNSQSMIIGMRPLGSTGSITVVPDRESSKKIIGIYNINGMRLNDFTTGINIIRYDDGTSKKVVIR